MIDLNKPIRRKDTKEPAVFLEKNDRTGIYTIAYKLNNRWTVDAYYTPIKFFENIPETKPFELYINIYLMPNGDLHYTCSSVKEMQDNMKNWNGGKFVRQIAIYQEIEINQDNPQ